MAKMPKPAMYIAVTSCFWCIVYLISSKGAVERSLQTLASSTEKKEIALASLNESFKLAEPNAGTMEIALKRITASLKMVEPTVEKMEAVLNRFNPSFRSVTSNGETLKRFSFLPSKCDYNEKQYESLGANYREGYWAQGSPYWAVRADAMTPPYYYDYGKEHLWKRASYSGAGSDLGAAVENSLQFLKEVIQKEKIRTMLDMPCGDVNWQTHAWEVDSLELYAGLDVVKSVIEVDQTKFAHHSNKLFQAWDLAHCKVPQFEAVSPSLSGMRFFDLVHVRDVIQHLPLAIGRRFLCHAVHSGAKYLIATTYPNLQNVQIPEAGINFYANNLEAPPFNLPKPVRCVDTHPSIDTDKTCLWKLTALASPDLTKELCKPL